MEKQLGAYHEQEGSILWKGEGEQEGATYTTKSRYNTEQEGLSRVMERPYSLHGMKKTRLYRIWTNMLTRCRNKNSDSYPYYGAKGIKVEWESFVEFLQDMHKPYIAHAKEFGEKDTTIDKFNNNKNYCKENCRWATKKEQYETQTFTVYKTQKRNDKGRFTSQRI